MLANQASSTPPTTAACSDQMMQDGAGRFWTSLGQSPGLQMAWRRLLVFRSDMERRSAVMSLIVGSGCGYYQVRGDMQLPKTASIDSVVSLALVRRVHLSRG